MDQKEKTQEKVKSILEHDTRYAVLTDNIKKDSQLDREYYSVSQTQKDNALIEKVLSGQSELGEISEQDRNRLLTVQSRNRSHILMNDYKTFSFEGKKMTSVKNNIFQLEKHLKETKFDEQVIKDIKMYFDTSIMACETYIENKHPWFPVGKRRKREVEERLKTLKEEKELYEWGLSAMQKGLTETVPQNHVDLIQLGRMQKSAAEMNAKEYGDHFKNMTNFAISATKEKFDKDVPEDDVEKVKLSKEAQAEFDAYFSSKDILEVIQTNKIKDRWARYNGLQDKNMYINESCVATVNDIFKLIHSTDETKAAAYAKNKAEIDEHFALFEKDMRAIDALSFFMGMMSTKKNSIDDDYVRAEVSKAMDAYYELLRRTQVVAGDNEKAIKKLMGV